jgi:RNA polymerase sigma factor (sigma-70 family)
MDERIAERIELERALQSLTSNQREVVSLRYLVGLSVSEVSHVLRIPEGTVKSATSRALTTLRESFEKLPEEVESNVE